MKRDRVLIMILCLLFISLAAIGCSDAKISEVKVESGVINQDYTGIVSSVLPQDYKIDEQAKDEMIKLTIKCGVEKEIPIEAGDEEQAGDSDAKPKI